MLELISVKEYSKREKISETATRKRLDKGFLNSTKLDDITYIVYKNNIEQTIKDLKAKIRYQREQINKYKQASNFYINQDEKIKELQIELKEYAIRERGLYEKVINQFNNMMLPNNSNNKENTGIN